MCEYCGCRGVQPLAELMDEHASLVDDAYLVRQALGAGDRAAATSKLTALVAHLERHVGREEAGVFRALRLKGVFVDVVDDLEREHRELHATIAGLDVGSPEFPKSVTRLLQDLDVHVERENLGIFPVSVVSLGAAGWQIVDEAHTASPSFLLDPSARIHQREAAPCRRSP